MLPAKLFSSNISNTEANNKSPFQYLLDAALAKIRQEQQMLQEASILDLSLPNNKRARTEDNQPMALVVTPRRNEDDSTGKKERHFSLSSTSSNGGSPSVASSSNNGYRCQECGKILPTRVGLKRHIFYHGKPFINTESCPFKCDVCTAAFSYRTSLEYHRVSHSLDGNERLANGSYKCDKCGRVFEGLKMLKRHKMKRLMNNNDESSCCNNNNNSGNETISSPSNSSP